MVNWKGFERKRCGVIEVSAQYSPAVTDEDHEKNDSG
jgi:hypothetical protein